MNINKILVVEDEKDTLFILEKLFLKNNYEVYTATSGQEALEILKKNIPDVIVADWTMPIMDGIELCDIVKRDEKYKLIYFILLTARASLKDRVAGLDKGADDFLVKPVQNQEIMARIRSGIRIHNLQNELKKIEHGKVLLEMAATIGHKINNPLSSLLMTIKNLEDELTAEENKFEDDFQIINKSIEKIKKLANDLTHIEVPEIIDYTSDSKMIKLE
ncbi:MAG TPA: response regulator [Ignavibacteria bacterium]|nr:response regulator [Ignavibacteria bacterium]